MSPASLFLFFTLFFAILDGNSAAYDRWLGIVSIATFTPNHNTGCRGPFDPTVTPGIVVPKQLYSKVPGNAGGPGVCGKCVKIYNDALTASILVPIVNYCDGQPYSCGPAAGDYQVTAKTFKDITGGATSGTASYAYQFVGSCSP